MKTSATRFLLAAVLTPALSGCISLSLPTQAKRPAFMVACKRAAPEAAAPGIVNAVTVRVRRFRTAEPFDSRRIVLLNAASGRIERLKNGDFAVVPGITASDTLRRWLADSKAFAGVVDTSAVVRGNSITLDGWVDKACVEIGEDGGAAFKLALTIWRQPSGPDTSATGASFRRETSVPIDSIEPSAIVDAFGMALGAIFTQFEPWLADAIQSN